MNQVWYHANCADGFGSAFAYMLLRDKKREAKYVPLNYGDPVPEYEDGDNIYILDFSFEPQKLFNILRLANVTVIDHHETSKNYDEAMEELFSENRLYEQQELRNFSFQHDQNHSGAVLTYLRLAPMFGLITPKIDLPLILQYVQDRDLWSWVLPYSHEINAAIQLLPNDFDRWILFAQELENNTGLINIVGQGVAILEREKKIIWRQVYSAEVGVLSGADNYFVSSKVAICNASVMQSETGNELLGHFKEAQFAALYWDDKGKRRWSLRSRKDGIDVSKIAQRFGGGGHASAAGFEEKYPGEKIQI